MRFLNYTTALGAVAIALSSAAISTANIPAAHAAPATTNQSGASSAATAQDDSYVTISGTVGSLIDDDEFYLNYGSGRVKVDTNDKWANMFKADANNAGRVLKEGDRIVVSGRVDNNWFANREIDATSIRHQSGGQVFAYDLDPNMTNLAGVDPGTLLDQQGRVVLTGTITRAINNDRYQMRYGTGQQANTIEVDTTGVDDNTISNLKVGDRITVIGKVDDTLFNRREINADNVQVGTRNGKGTTQQGSIS